MASEWAIAEATKIHINWVFAQQYQDATAVLAEALDAARIKGLEEAAKLVQQQAGILATVPPVYRAAGYADAIKICTAAIRARIKEAKR